MEDDNFMENSLSDNFPMLQEYKFQLESNKDHLRTYIYDNEILLGIKPNLSLDDKIYIMKYACWSNNINKFDMFSDSVDLTVDSNIFFKLALNNRCTNMVEHLVSLGVDFTFDDDYTIKCVAGYYIGEGLQTLKFLIQQGANIHTDNEYPLKHAVFCNNLESVKILVENGANIYVDDNYAILMAAELEYWPIIEYFISLGIDVTIKNNFILKQFYDVYKYTKILLEHGADANSLDGYDWIELIRDKNIEVIELLINNGSDLSILDKNVRMEKSTKYLIDLLTNNGLDMKILLGLFIEG